MPLPAPDVGYTRVGQWSDSEDEEEEQGRRGEGEVPGESHGSLDSNSEEGPANGEEEEEKGSRTSNGHHKHLRPHLTDIGKPFPPSPSSSSFSLSSLLLSPPPWLWLLLCCVVGALLVVVAMVTLDVTGLSQGSPSSLLSRMFQGSFGPFSYHRKEGEEADPSLQLTAAESEMVEILTGQSSVSRLSSTLLPLLRLALHRLAVAATILRPSIQRELWVNNCRGHTPCPFPNAFLRRDATSPIPDSTVRELHLNSRPAPLSTWMVDWFDTPDVEALFHTHRAATTVTHPAIPNNNSTTTNETSTFSNSFSFSSLSPSPSFPSLVSYFAPGESEADQSLSQRFQFELYLHQHPVNCSAQKVLILDFYHAGGGFGSWNHARSIPMAIAIRSGRVLIEAPQYSQWAYSIAWNDCVVVRGMGGCDIFLAASNCTVPDNWRDFALAEQGAHKDSKPAFTGQGLDALLDWYSERKFLFYSEMKKISGEEWELHHKQAIHWEPETLFYSLPARLQPYRLMPECWWMRQILAYNTQRLTQYGRDRVVPAVIRTLQLTEPKITSNVIQRYAEAHSPSINQTSHWWLLVQAIKLTWQMQQIAPGLAEALREEVVPVTSEIRQILPGPPSPWTAEAAKYLKEPPSRFPLLSYTFVRHGDKGAEIGLMEDHVYLQQANVLAQTHGLRQWYVGADSLFSSDAIRTRNAEAPHPLRLYSSIQTDETTDKRNQPFAAGFDKDLSFSKPFTEKEPIIWNTLIHHSVAQVSDVYLSSWSSNHVRFSYEIGTALSEARATAPFVAMDVYKYLIIKEGCTSV